MPDQETAQADPILKNKVRMRHPHTKDTIECIVAELTPWMVKGYEQVRDPIAIAEPVQPPAANITAKQ